MMDHSTTKQRAEELFNMRTFIRKKYQDVRAREDVARQLWSFVRDVSHKYHTDHEFMPASSKTRSTTSKTKRTRARDDSDEEMGSGRSTTKSRRGNR